jgi:hypothetical protein
MTLAAVLPLAFVMIAGPQIITSFFFATSDRWAAKSLCYLGGAAISVTALVSATFFVAKGSAGSSGERTTGTAGDVMDWIVLVLVVVLIVRVFLRRKVAQPPTWMGRLQEATPGFALRLGVLLFGLMPTDILAAVTVGLHVAHHGEAWWECLPFVAVTLLLLGLPAIAVVVLGSRADTVLPGIRNWMNDNSWVVSEIVLVFFAAVTASSLLG